MVLGILTVLGVEFELALVLRRRSPTIPPSAPRGVVETTGEAVEEAPARPLAKCASNVVPLRRVG